MKSFAIRLLLAGSVLAAWNAPAGCQDFSLEIPNLGAKPGEAGELRIARTPEPMPVPLPAVESPANDGQLTLEELTAQELERTFATNVFACFHLVKAALPHLKPGSAISVAKYAIDAATRAAGMAFAITPPGSTRSR